MEAGFIIGVRPGRVCFFNKLPGRIMPRAAVLTWDPSRELENHSPVNWWVSSGLPPKVASSTV